MKCGKSYSVSSTNPKMSGSSGEMRYGGSYKYGGMVKSYQEGGIITDEPEPAMSESKGPPRRLGPAKGRAKREMMMQQAEQREMDRKMQRAREEFEERKRRGE